MPWTHQPWEEPPHDVLAAEAFAVPAPDPALHHVAIVPPEDPSGIEEPHDVLAAEEFPMPAVAGARRGVVLTQTAQDFWPLGLAALLGALTASVLLRLRRRR